jgi:hypothetical protein
LLAFLGLAKDIKLAPVNKVSSPSA